MMNDFINFNGTLLRRIPHAPDSGEQFYVSSDGKIGLHVAPDGVQTVVNATPTTCVNSTNQSNANRKQRYLQFKHAFGKDKHILVSHAVYLAWSGQRIPLYHQIHHLNGIVTDNYIDNLLCVLISQHYRIADVRQRALETIVPDGDLTCFSYQELRRLQDPRTLSDEDFRKELSKIIEN